MFAGKKSAQIREILISESAWEEMTCLFAPSLAEEVILTREEFPGCSLAELYDPDKMPHELLTAHQALDKAVDRLYRDRPFKDATDRLSCLLARYEALVQN